MFLKSIIQFNNPEYNVSGYGDIANLISQNGVLLAIFQRQTTNDDESYSNIWAKCSRDAGVSWKFLTDFEVPLLPNIGLQSSGWVSIAKMNNGSWILVFLAKNSTPTVLQLYMAITSNPFTSPFNYSGIKKIPNQKAGYNVLKNNVIQVLSSGNRIIIPIALLVPTTLQGSYQFYCLYSDDNGGTWTAGDNLIANESLKEPGIVETSPNNLIAYFRTDTGSVYFSRSIDNGAHWSPPGTSTLLSTDAPCNIIKLNNSNTLLAATNPPGIPFDIQHRAVLRLSTSTDGGNSWPNFLDFEPSQLQGNTPSSSKNHYFQYPSLQHDGSKIYLSYIEQIEDGGGSSGPGNNRFASFDLSDLGIPL